MMERKAQPKRKLAIAKSKKAKAESEKTLAGSIKARELSFSKNVVVRDIMFEAKVLGISEGAAEKFAEKVSERVTKWAEQRESITEDDINTQIAKEINKYSKDLAFVYKNRGKII